MDTAIPPVTDSTLAGIARAIVADWPAPFRDDGLPVVCGRLVDLAQRADVLRLIRSGRQVIVPINVTLPSGGRVSGSFAVEAGNLWPDECR